MKAQHLTIVFLVALSCSACAESMQLHLTTVLNGATVDATIDKVQSAPGVSGSAAVYGKIRLYSNKPIKWVNLECIRLAAGKTNSNKLYVDSIASVLAERYSANNHSAVEVPVYWVFTSRKPSDIDFGSARLMVRNNGRRCITYAAHNK